MKQSRRTFIKGGIAGAITSAGFPLHGTDKDKPIIPTPAEIEGPFYPIQAQKDTDFDLTKIADSDRTAKGRQIYIEGKVCDTEMTPLEDVTVELWQANAAGRYNHPHDSNPAPLDPNFQGWAIVPSGVNGGFRFKTVFPGAYAVSNRWTRPPHIHFKVTKRGYEELITQMYFPGHKLNEVDGLLKRKSPSEQNAMISVKTNENPETYQYQIVIQKV